MSTETIADMANKAMGNRHPTPPNPLEALAATQAPDEWGPDPHDNQQWTQSPTKLQGYALTQVDVYLE